MVSYLLELGLFALGFVLPPLELTNNLPSHKACCYQGRIAHENYYLCARRKSELGSEGGELWAYWNDACEDSVHRSWTWWHAEHATNPKLNFIIRRKHLRDLIEYAGWRAVCTGEFPTPINLATLKTK